jgi:hypothetical protein
MSKYISINNNDIDSKIDLSKYSLDELINSKIYINYQNQFITNSENKNYLIKNNLKPSEYITEIFFNIENNELNIFNKLGIFDIETKNIRYKTYVVLDDEYNNNDNNITWTAKNNNALVGIELYYDKIKVIRIRFLEASINKKHNNKNKPIYSNWYGLPLEEKNENNISCIDCNIKSEYYQFIYLNNMFISGFQLKYSKLLQSFGKIFFKIGTAILSELINVNKCCTYEENSLEYKCCKIIDNSFKCSINDKKNIFKNKINNELLKILKPNSKNKLLINTYTNNLIDEIYNINKDNINKDILSNKENIITPITNVISINKNIKSALSENFNSDNIEHFNNQQNNDIFSNIFKITIILLFFYICYIEYKKNK